MAKVFLSHSSKDRVVADKIAKSLSLSGIDVWYDAWEIRVGNSISHEIQKGLKEADFIVVILTKNSVKSGWVQKEWQSKIGVEVSEDRAVILPVRAEKCEIPPLLSDKRYADIYGDFDVGIQDLIQDIIELEIQRKYERIHTGNWNLPKIFEFFGGRFLTQATAYDPREFVIPMAVISPNNQEPEDRNYEIVFPTRQLYGEALLFLKRVFRAYEFGGILMGVDGEPVVDAPIGPFKISFEGPEFRFPDISSFSEFFLKDFELSRQDNFYRRALKYDGLWSEKSEEDDLFVHTHTTDGKTIKFIFPSVDKLNQYRAELSLVEYVYKFGGAYYSQTGFGANIKAWKIVAKNGEVFLRFMFQTEDSVTNFLQELENTFFEHIQSDFGVTILIEENIETFVGVKLDIEI